MSITKDQKQKGNLFLVSEFQKSRALEKRWSLETTKRFEKTSCVGVKAFLSPPVGRTAVMKIPFWSEEVREEDLKGK